MKNNLDPQKLLAMIREEFLKDPEDNMDKLKEAIDLLPFDTEQALSAILQICHNIKGSAQAVGFIHFSSIFHELESIFTSNKISHTADENKKSQIANLFDNLYYRIKSYRELLKYNFEDDSAFLKETSLSLQTLKKWFEEYQEAEKVEINSKNGIVELKGWGYFEDENTKQTSASVSLTKVEKANISNLQDKYSLTATTNETSEIFENVLESMQFNQDHIEEKYLLVEQNNQLFGVPLLNVKEIISSPEINKLPENSPGICGVISVRDLVLPVLDLRWILGNEKSWEGDETRRCTIICEEQSKIFAFNIEKPWHVISLNSSKIEKISDYTKKTTRQVINRITTYKDRTVLLLDLERVFT